MSPTYNHIIGTTNINIQYNGSVDGLALQHKINSWYQHQLLPALDNAFSSQPIDEMITIDTIEIDVSLTYADDWLQQLTNKIIVATKGKFVDTKSVFAVKIESQNQSAQSFTNTLIYFLQNGFLPWNSVLVNKQQLQEASKNWLQNASASELERVWVLVSKNALAAGRFVKHFSDDFFIEWVAKNGAINATQLRQILEDIEYICDKVNAGEAQEWQLIFKQYVLQNVQHVLLESIVLKSFNAWVRQVKPSAKALQQISLSNLLNSHLHNAFTTLVSKAVIAPAFEKELPINSGIPAANKEVQIVPGTLDVNKQSSKKASANKVAEAIFENPKTVSLQIKKELARGVFINNAGIIIIALFLPMFFKNAGLLNNDIFADTNTAIQLLHYVLTGNNTPAEFELLLPKILCGVPAETPVNIDVKLTDDQKKDGDEMLLSVIEFWSVLKDTSIDGLRQSFLQREGKLTFTDSSWLLQVAPKTYDVLLQSLPWGISMIKLSWMKEMIKIEWI